VRLISYSNSGCLRHGASPRPLSPSEPSRSTTIRSRYLLLGVSSLSLEPLGGRALGFVVVPGSLGWPGTGRAGSLAGGPSGADPEPVPGVICVLGGVFGLVGPVVCAYALPAITVATAAALISFNISCSIVVAVMDQRRGGTGVPGLSLHRCPAFGSLQNAPKWTHVPPHHEVGVMRRRPSWSLPREYLGLAVIVLVGLGLAYFAAG
jgi:hypothetical protein